MLYSRKEGWRRGAARRPGDFAKAFARRASATILLRVFRERIFFTLTSVEGEACASIVWGERRLHIRQVEP